MTTLNSLYISKKTLNSGHIFFKDIKKAEEWRDVLISERVQFITFIWKIHNTTYYGFKMYRMRYQFMTLCSKFKELMEGV